MKPQIEVEVYQLQQDVAQNCGIVVDSGPAMGKHPQCENYKDPFEGLNAYAANRPKHVNFYEDTCDCYYSASGNYFTS